jgi:hypothetical protein
MPHRAGPRQISSTVARRRERSHGAPSRCRGAAQDPSSTPAIARPSRSSRRLPASIKQYAQVAGATLLVAGCPIAIVWWLRSSGTISSSILCLALGMGLSLGASQLGRVLWEKRPGSADLLFSELMVWGYLHRLHTQHRLASALDTLGPMSQTQRRDLDGLSTKERAKLLERLVTGMETRDPYLHGHSRRVARHSWMIARRMGLSSTEVARIRTAAAIHDVGKTKTPTAVLHKPGRLTDEEFEVIKKHPGDGAPMAAVLRDPELTAMVLHHHERLDGAGYPDGLSGDEIPLGARIIAVADTFDAITSERPYRRASSHKTAIDILKDEAGTRLDAAVVRAFCGHYAGRRPLALWAFAAALPERAISWLGGSVASVASAAKVAAVAALVGGAAVTSSTIGLPVAKHQPAKTRSDSTTGQRAQIAGSASLHASSISSAATTPGSGHASRTRRSAATPAGGVAAPQPSALGTAGRGSSQGAGPAGGGGVAPGKGETPKGTTPGTPSKGKPESPSEAKSVEAPIKTETPSTGKVIESPAKPKPEEAPHAVKEAVKVPVIEPVKEVVKEVVKIKVEVPATVKEVLGKLK